MKERGQDELITEQEEAEDLIRLAEIINAKGDVGEIQAIQQRNMREKK
ncbi:hypothetical protein [Ectobacillus ponti]|uniref:Uncharacterized protein n=1 Tax=Ectobacillus ponti TaxID=2961894 RepID=A0AA41X824_9BACI|nr:hypothetical protein [Ectobacillus ponti]MCP8968404.1 hypothetical protein [Ectobacillus ponti]